VTATTSDPAGVVTVDGRVAPGGTRTLTGLAEGDEVAVFITDSGGTARHSFVYLPPKFPALERVTPDPAPGALAPGLVLLTIGLWTAPSPYFETAVDVNGVPAFVRQTRNAIDLQRQPNGRYSVFEPTTVAGRTGSDLIELDSQWHEVARHRTVGLVNTDGHDAIVRPDGTVWLMAYEPNGVTHLTDSVIQEIKPNGTPGFTWSSAAYAGETVTAGNPDYAHLNSIQLLPDGDVLASFRHLSSVYRIATYARPGFAVGDVVWKLGGRDSDFTFPAADDTGPCAQHTARMLPDGHVLMYDNGSWSASTSLCVDQADPTGPPVERVQTRVVEYALDTSLHTATIAGSYEPAGRFGIFAGSAQRLDNGNTEIGWAEETTALASEVALDGTLLWELRDPGPDPRWFTYRAHKAVVPDAFAPAVAVAVPADGATYVEGATVTSSYDCSDRGGSSLQSCTASPVDTTTPGAHTMTVSAADGAGGTTTVTRHYTVVAGSRPDVMARPRGAAAYAGDGVHSPAAQQVRTRVRRPVRLEVRVRNDGARADTLTWSAGRTSRFVVRGPRTGTTPVLQPGQVWTFVLRVRLPRHPSGRRLARLPVQVSSTSTGRSDTLIWRLSR
jgi:Arylsulfotransferase (ASST)